MALSEQQVRCAARLEEFRKQSELRENKFLEMLQVIEEGRPSDAEAASLGFMLKIFRDLNGAERLLRTDRELMALGLGNLRAFVLESDMAFDVKKQILDLVELLIASSRT